MDKALGAFLFIKDRLSEPSTHASLAAVCAMMGHNLDESMLQSILDTATLGFGVMGFFVAEAQAKTTV